MVAEMKYIIVLADGMADRPLPQLNGLTPMAQADKPHMDALAAGGHVGLCRTVADGMVPGSDVANMAILGYAPQKYLRGRATLEAKALGIEPAAEDLVLRANLVTLSDEAEFGERRLLDYCAGDVAPPVAAELFALLAQNLPDENCRIFAGNGFRGIWQTRCVGECSFKPAHDMMGERLADNYPQGAGAEQAIEYMKRAAEILSAAPYNRKQRQLGLPLANGLWLWGPGRPMCLPDFGECRGVKGALVAGSSLIKGIGLAAGLQPLVLSTATGCIVTDFAGKGRIAAEYLLDGGDFVFVHIEAPDEAGHHGDVAAKLRAIERIDNETLPPIIDGLAAAGEAFRLIVMPDHATPLALRTHTAEPVPFLLFDSRTDKLCPGGRFSEAAAKQGDLGEIEAADLLPLLFERQNDGDKRG